MAMKRCENICKDPDLFTEAWFSYMEHEARGDRKYDYRLSPDNIERWTGLISPDGRFFSCSYGGHDVKSMHLVLKRPYWFGIDVKVSDDELPDIHGLDLSNALGFALEHGWCATRYIPGPESFVDLPAGGHEITQKQIDRIFYAIVKHGKSPAILKDILDSF